MQESIKKNDNSKVVIFSKSIFIVKNLFAMSAKNKIDRLQFTVTFAYYSWLLQTDDTMKIQDRKIIMWVIHGTEV